MNIEHCLVRGAVLLAASAASLSALAAGGHHPPPPPLELCAIPGTLGQHLENGTGNKFDYDPSGLATTRIKGHYRPSSGKVHWTETPAADSYLSSTNVIGDVTRSPGQVDVHYESSATEDNGTVVSTEVEQTFEGCTLTQRTRPLGGTDNDWLNHQGTLSGDVYSYAQERYSRRDGSKIQLVGQRYTDGSFSESYSVRCGWADCSEEWSGDADGNTSVYWEQNWGDAYIWGRGEDHRDGSKHRYVRWVWEWCVPWFDVTVAYDGNGSGSANVCELVSVEVEPGEWWEEAVYVPCTVSVANGSCTQTCQNGAISSCDHLL